MKAQKERQLDSPAEFDSLPPEKQAALLVWIALQLKLEPRLPDVEREPREAGREIDEVLVYLNNVRNVVFGAVNSLVIPREKPNLTAYAKVVMFEKENAGRVLVDEALGRAAVASVG